MMNLIGRALLAGLLLAAAAPVFAEEGDRTVTLRRTLEADGWSITSEVESGNSRLIGRSGEGHFVLSPREDPVTVDVQRTGPISNYILYVEIANRLPVAREIQIDVLIPQWLITYKFDYFLRKPYLLRAPDNLDWYEIDAARQESLEDRVRLRIPFAPRERKILSTEAVYPYSKVREKLFELEARSKGKARIREIGLSVEGRPILSLEIGDKQKPRALFSATLQPGEPSAWAILSMAEAVISDPEMARFQERYDLAFIPMTNPDGVVGGMCNVNSKGEIIMLGFEAARQGQGKDEAKVLWDYMAEKPPVAFIDFHTLRLPRHPAPRPYVFDPALYADPARRSQAESQTRRLESLTGVEPGTPITADHPMWKHLATFNAIRQWSTVSNLYQYTGPLSSYTGALSRGIEVMRVVLDPGYRK